VEVLLLTDLLTQTLDIAEAKAWLLDVMLFTRPFNRQYIIK
jgi:arginine deiminase